MNWSDTPEGKEFIAKISKEMVSQIAPEELEIADELLEDYFKNPQPPDKSTQSADNTLGFGVNEAFFAATPAAAAVVSAALALLVGMYAGGSAQPGSPAGQAEVQLLLSGKAGNGAVSQMTSQQIEQLQQVGLNTAGEYGMNPQQAQQMANALVVSLAALFLKPSSATGAPSSLGTASPAAKKVKILFLSASPRDATPLALSEEVRAIDEALLKANFRDRFELFQQWAVRVSDLQGLFLRFQPDVVHFSGHGSQSGQLILEDVNGSAQPVPAEALSDLFRVLRDNIRCVVLNACFSQTQASAIAEHIDAVVGMSSAIDDRSALNFSMSFYRGLGYGRDLLTAFDLGVGQIKLESLPAQNTPRLIARRTRPDQIFLLGN